MAAPIDPLTAEAVKGLATLPEYGIAGIMLLLLLAGGAFICRFFMQEFKKCHENTISVYKEESALNREVNAKNTEAFRGVELALVKLESRLDK